MDLLATKTVNLTDDVIEEAKQIAANQIPDKCYMTEQKVHKWIIDGEYCLSISTTYMSEYGTESCVKEYIYKL